VKADVFLSLIASLFGGSIVSAITYATNPGRIRAETAKLEAETKKVKAETRSLLTPLHPSTGGHHGVPPGWSVDGRWLDGYEISVDRTVAHSGGSSALIKALHGARGFATLMQTITAHEMLGHRVKMSAFLRLEDVDAAGLWMRVDDPNGLILAFDDMEERFLRGTSDWRQHSVVLDVPTTSSTIFFGALLFERGCLWVDDFTIEAVDTNVPTTSQLTDETLHSHSPENLGFED
jgi:hypothetical protein